VGKASKKTDGKGASGASSRSATPSRPAASASKPAAKLAAPARSTSPTRSPGKPVVPPTALAAKSAPPPPAKSSRQAAATPAHSNGNGNGSRGKTSPPPTVTKAVVKPPAPAKSAAVTKPAVAPPPAPRTDARSTRAQKPVRIETKPERRESHFVPATPPPPPPPVSPPAPRVEPVSSSGDSKPKKNQAGLTSKELDVFRDLLLEKRRELIGDMNSMEREALAAAEGNLSTLPIHMADMGTDNYEQEFTLGLVEKDRVLLREINHALAKIQNGSYGICEGNGQPIGKVRLEAQPWARHSIEFVRSKEKRAGGR
jgi:DnaK suppressor protein